MPNHQDRYNTITPEQLERAYQRVIHWADRDEETGCLVSRYSCGSHGYAQGWDGEHVTLCHLIVWRRVNGPIPRGMTVDHFKCRNRKCIEITHLRLLSNLENARRTNGRDWPLGTCRQGHDSTWWNPKSEKNSKGYCHACRMLTQARRRGMAYTKDVSKPRF